MRVRVTAADFRSENAERLDVLQKTYLLPQDVPQPPGGFAGKTPVAFERELRAGGVSHVIIDADGVRVVADHRGSRHLYCHRAEGARGPELTITDRSPLVCRRSLDRRR